MNRYDILESISQGENGTMPAENTLLVQIAADIRRATEGSFNDETESFSSREHVMLLNEREKRYAEMWAKEHDLWIEFHDIFSLGAPGPSGSESDTYLGNNGFIYKSNNMMHCGDSIIKTLIKFIIYNQIFPDSAYSFVGFTGFSGRSVFPIVKQAFIKESVPATKMEIRYYMAALGFQYVEEGKFFNGRYLLKDILPKNVLKDSEGDLYTIDAEIEIL